MRSLLNICLILLCATISFCQSGTVSSSYQNGGTTLKVDWAVGELITESFSSPNIKAAQSMNELVNVFIITGDIEEKNASTSIYPIPFSDHFFIENKEGIAANIRLVDISGKAIDIAIESESDQKKKVNTSSLVQGAYLLIIETASNPKTYKLIKQ